MLHLEYSKDDACFPKLFAEIFGAEPPNGIRVTLLDDEQKLGVAVVCLNADAVPIIKYLGLLSQYRHKRYGDFFMRSLFYTLTQGGNGLYVDWVHPYFAKFGFKPDEDGKLYVLADSLVYPSSCGGH